jgi:hypothetical protein
VAYPIVKQSLDPKFTTQLLIDHLTERKHSICASCGFVTIVSADEADAHRRRGHDVLDLCDSKTNLVVN